MNSRQQKRMGRIAISIALFTVGVYPISAQDSRPMSVVKSEFIYVDGPTRSCHASTIEETSVGLVAAWFGGTYEKHDDVGIWVSHCIEGNWSNPILVANGSEGEDKDYPCWNPVLFRPRKGPLMLFYKVGPSPDTWWGMLITSTDNGQTWSKPQRLPNRILGPVKNKPIQLEQGDILCGTSTEDQGWRVHFERTSDLGQTWKSSGPVNDGLKIGAIQPSFLIHGNNRLQAVGRTEQGYVFEIWSSDGGVTWGPLALTQLPNPNAGTDAVTLKNGNHLLVYNHTAKGRSPLNVASSNDGKNWNAISVLEDLPGEYSYPAVIQTSDGLVHVTYTWKRTRIKHVVLDPAQFQGKPIVEGRWPG